MDSRFTLKDVVFLALFVVVIGAVLLVGWQFSYQEQRLNELKGVVGRLNDTMKEQTGVLGQIRDSLRGGVRVAGTDGAGSQPGHRENIRRTEADGSQYVNYPDPPLSPRDPTKQPDYAPGDWLVQNIGGEPKVIAPFIEKDMQGQFVHTPVVEALLGQNPATLEWEPLLADWFRVSADGLKFTFHLRNEACFSDGEAVTADDVLFSYNTLMNEGVDAASLRSYFDGVTCRKIDDRTVEFTRKEPYFLALEFIGGGLSIIPEHVYKFTNPEDYNRKGDVLVSTGPYKVEKWDRGQKITFVRNEHYYGQRPAYDKIVYVFIGNSQAQMRSFLNGELDLLADPIPPDPEEFLKYAKDPEFVKKYTPLKFTRPNSMYMYIGWNLERPMFKDKATRRALTMLIDRQSIIENMLHGFGVEMNGPLKPNSKQIDTTVPLIPYDPAGAKKLLAEAGWKPGPDGVLVRDGVRFEFALSLRSGVQIRERIATYVQQQLQQAGIRVKLTPYEASVLIGRIDVHDFDGGLMGWGGGGAEEDPKQIWSSTSIANKGSNHVSFRNEEADRLIEEGRKTMDTEKRIEIWHKFQRIVYDEQPYTFLYAESDCAIVDGRFKNVKPYPLGLAEYATDWYVPAGLQKYK